MYVSPDSLVFAALVVIALVCCAAILTVIFASRKLREERNALARQLEHEQKVKSEVARQLLLAQKAEREQVNYSAELTLLIGMENFEVEPTAARPAGHRLKKLRGR